MTVATELATLLQLIGTGTEGREDQRFTAVYNVLAALAETTATELTTVDNTVPRFDGTEGALQTSSVVVDDSDNVSGIGTLTTTGAATIGGAAGIAGGITFTKTAASVGLSQTAEDTASTDGEDMPIVAQTAGGATSTGGTAYLQGGTGTTANGGAELRDSSGTAVVAVGATDDTLGFYNATPAAKPTVTGSAASNAALISLLSELETLGLITDGSS